MSARVILTDLSPLGGRTVIEARRRRTSSRRAEVLADPRQCGFSQRLAARWVLHQGRGRQPAPRCPARARARRAGRLQPTRHSRPLRSPPACSRWPWLQQGVADAFGLRRQHEEVELRQQLRQRRCGPRVARPGRRRLRLQLGQHSACGGPPSASKPQPGPVRRAQLRRRTKAATRLSGSLTACMRPTAPITRWSRRLKGQDRRRRLFRREPRHVNAIADAPHMPRGRPTLVR